jgi:hypothetical protein
MKADADLHGPRNLLKGKRVLGVPLTSNVNRMEGSCFIAGAGTPRFVFAWEIEKMTIASSLKQAVDFLLESEPPRG